MASVKKRKQAVVQEDTANRTLERDGITYAKWDPIRISGEKGTFRFWSWANGENGPIVTVWWDGYHFRSFYLTRVKPPLRKKQKK